MIMEDDRYYNVWVYPGIDFSRLSSETKIVLTMVAVIPAPAGMTLLAESSLT